MSDGKVERLPEMSKSEVAKAIIDQVVRLTGDAR
jgi:phosphopantothenoylcysteine synthetase/decarboxylase